MQRLAAWMRLVDVRVPGRSAIAVSLTGCLFVVGSASQVGIGRAQGPPTVSATDAACNTDQLRAVVFGPAGAAGSSVYRIRISDVGGPCVLRGSPSFLRGVDAAGNVEGLNPTPLAADDTESMASGEPADLTNASSADVVLLAGYACPAAAPQAAPTQTFGSLQLGVESGTLDVAYMQGTEPFDTNVWLPCGVAMSGFYASYSTTSSAAQSGQTFSAPASKLPKSRIEMRPAPQRAAGPTTVCLTACRI